MDDYMDRQTAADLLDNLIGMVEDTQENDYDAALKMGIEALKADVQPVVRCKDCRLSEHDIGITEYWCCYWDNKTLENGYCSYGERKV